MGCWESAGESILSLLCSAAVEGEVVVKVEVIDICISQCLNPERS